jgi:DNA polymerase-1
MTARGIALRRDRVRAWYEELNQRRLFFEDICTKEGMNPNSPQQVGTILASRGNFLPFTDRTHKRLKTDEEVLEGLTDPLATVILEHRKLTKLIGTYFRPRLNKPRVYTHFRQDLSTSRLSSYDVNLMNLPEATRDILEADSGTWTWMDADQLETRILAHAAQDPIMLAAYERGEDAHWVTQQFLWPGTSRDDGGYRLKAKTFNHAMAYRAQDWTLAKHTKLPVSVCQEYKQAWLDKYQAVSDWQLETIEAGWEHGWVENMFGRRCRLPKLDPMVSGVTPNHIEKCAVNYPVQSTAADYIKRAMLDPDVIGLDQALQVHDEILVDGDVEFPERLAGLGPLPTPFKTKRGHTWV